jgi:hypothetical protein
MTRPETGYGRRALLGDAAAFLTTAGAVLCANAVAAVALGCTLYAAHHAYMKLSQLNPELRPVGRCEAEA